MGSRKEVDDTTTRILDAALTCFADRGVRRTTMNQIADLAGVGVATAYRRFPQKAELVRAVILREAAEVTERVADAMEQPVGIVEQSAGGFTAFAHALADRPLLVDLMRRNYADTGVSGAEAVTLDQVIAMARTYIAGWLRRYQAAGRFTHLDADIIGEIHARLALSLVLSPDGAIPMHDDAATHAFARTYLLPLLGQEVVTPADAQA